MGSKLKGLLLSVGNNNEMTSNSNLSIEIKIQDLNFLLPLHEDSTIATVTTQAFSEYTKICRKNAPKKVFITIFSQSDHSYVR